MPRSESRLAKETSPYLLQHAQNPVDWHPWGEEAFAKARAENKPILLSIGYAACHYCHVMERESFQNESTAQLMNDAFVCIKVDREERPDIDDVYMTATVAMNGSGGWPMTVFLTPEGAPFFAGTYFPPADSEGRIGFPRLLKQLTKLWKEKNDDLLGQAKELHRHVQAQYQSTKPGGVSADSIRVAARALERDFDSSFGGFGGAPKFPPAPALRLLLRYHLVPGQQDALRLVTRTLDGMMTGGFYDQLGGGFFRYSVDERWHVPHFEKMLYDNAELSKVYVEAFQATGHVPYRRIACETLDFVLREMQSPQGGFFSSLDADSEGEEGVYYLWTRKQITQVLGGKAATAFCEFYGVAEEGPLAGASVLSTRRSLSSVAKELGLAEDGLLLTLEEARSKMLEARAARTAPHVDDKVLASWNGLFIGALAQGARAFGDPRYLEAAIRAAEFVLAAGETGEGLRRRDGGLYRTSRAGRSQINGFLDDYAFMSDGLLSLYEAGAGARYLSASLELAEIMWRDFSDPERGGLFTTSKNHESLIARPRDGHDGAIPSANAIACQVLTRLAQHTGRAHLQEQAQSITEAFSSQIKRSPRAYCGLLTALDSLLVPAIEIILSGNPESASWSEMAETLGKRYLPYRIEARITRESDLHEASALTRNRFSPDEPTRAYVCKDFSCKKPAESLADLVELLAEAEADANRHRMRELGRDVIKGRATASATHKFAQDSRLSSGIYSNIQGFTASRVGLGTYRIGLDHPAHRAAVREALLSGINLIDTSPSFALGDSERLLGEVLAELTTEGQLQRESLLIISKVGVAQGSEAERLSARHDQEKLRFAIPLQPVTSDPAAERSLALGAFSTDPEFIKQQITGSLERLGVEHLDFCLLQSPEHLLAGGLQREKFGAALDEAFSALEGEVSAGRIGAYGVLCNTLERSEGDPLKVELKELISSAERVNPGGHHLKVLAVPINVIESESLRSSSTNPVSTVELARSKGLSVLACRPLSAMVDGAVLRLADPPAAQDGGLASALSSSRYKVASLEAEFETTLATQLRLTGRVRQDAILPLSGALGQAIEQVRTRQQFELAETTLVTPRLRHLLGQLDRAFSGPGEGAWTKFRERYVQAVGAWLAAVRERASDENRRMLAEAQTELPNSGLFSEAQQAQLKGDSPWAQKAVSVLTEFEAIASVLVGLRKPDQVHQVLAPFKKSPDA